ncbi:MAG TPA: FAD binding domain-containing protein [Steroidobacteraceae bacterium]|nr:FAD binding domain-containing protein [Steroidobacteraceae bacterium]
MKPPAFEYLRPSSLSEAAVMLEQAGDGAQILAGGQSLVPTLSLRLSSPSLLIDINRVVDSAPLERREGMVRLGSRIRHVDVERSTLIREHVPLLALAMPHVAHPAIRNRGTPCGSVALADPAAEIPACALALNAEILLQSSTGRRTVPAGEYFIGLYETARLPTEIVVELRFPEARIGDRFGFVELARRHGDFAIVGIAAAVQVECDQVRNLRLVIFGCEPKPRVSAAAHAMTQGLEVRKLPIEEVAAAVAAELDPMENSQGDAAAKRQQTYAMAKRVMWQLNGRAA